MKNFENFDHSIENTKTDKKIENNDLPDTYVSSGAERFAKRNGLQINTPYKGVVDLVKSNGEFTRKYFHNKKIQVLKVGRNLAVQNPDNGDTYIFDNGGNQVKYEMSQETMQKSRVYDSLVAQLRDVEAFSDEYDCLSSQIIELGYVEPTQDLNPRDDESILNEFEDSEYTDPTNSIPDDSLIINPIESFPSRNP